MRMQIDPKPEDEVIVIGLSFGYSVETKRLGFRMVGADGVKRLTGPTIDPGGDVTSWVMDVLLYLMAHGIIGPADVEPLVARAHDLYIGLGFTFSRVDASGAGAAP